MKDREVAVCLSAGEKQRGKRGAGQRPAPFCGGSEARQRGKKGGSSSGGATWHSSAVGPGPDSRAASRSRPGRPQPSRGMDGQRGSVLSRGAPGLA
jgi:hypothetical protein